MTPTGSVYIKIEDWAEGVTLIDTLHSEQANGIGRKASELVQYNYEQQHLHTVQNGMYQIHPDVHGGQFHISTNGDGERTYVYVLDRGFWLEFSEQESTFFKFINGEEFSSDKAAEYLQYLYGLPENNTLSKAKKLAITTQVILTGGNALRLGSSASETAIIMMLELRKAGVKIPLKWTLLQKNNQYLKTLSFDSNMVH